MSKKLLAVAALMVGFAVAASAADPATLKILSFTGQIQIKIGNEVIGVVPGGKMPEIPAGAQITVVSGEATLQSGNTVVKADAGDAFTFNTGQGGGVQIAAVGDKTSLSVTVGNTTAKVESGDSIEVVGKGAGGGELKVTSGSVEMTAGGKTTTVAEGGTATAAPTTTTAQTTTTTQTQTSTTETSETSETTTSTNEPPPPPPPNPVQDQAVSGSTP